MSNPALQPRIDGHTLLRWCAHAAIAGLFPGVGTGAATLIQ